MTSLAASADTKLNESATPTGLAESTRAEFAALLSGCAIYDLSGRAKLAITGGDRVRWLNGMISNNVRDLPANQGVYSFVLNAQGRIQADLYAFQRGESLLVETESQQREKVLQLFDRYIIADDVEIADLTDKLSSIGLTGSQAREVLERAGIVVAELTVAELTGLQFVEAKWRETPITVVRSEEVLGDSWQVWIEHEYRSQLWQELERQGGLPVSVHALNAFRISRGIPQFGVDIRDRDLPQETGQNRALSFTKGCYLGQEIVERIRSRGAVHRQFAAFDVSGPLPEAGTKIVAGEKAVGEVTSGALLPFADGDRSVALGYLRREAAGKELVAGAAKLTVASLPITGAFRGAVTGAFKESKPSAH